MKFRPLPKPFYQREDVTLYLGDAQDILPRIPKADVVIADIPYGEVNRPSSGLRNLDKGDADDVTFPTEFVVSQSCRLANSIYIWCGINQVSPLRMGFSSQGLSTRLCGWEKTNPSPINGDRLWLSSFECCVFARKVGAVFNMKCASSIWRGKVEQDQVHPTQKPLWLLDKLVRASTPDDGVVVDFCCGSGTTGVACVRMGKGFVGIEINEEYADTARRRIDREFRRPRLIPPRKLHKQKPVTFGL